MTGFLHRTRWLALWITLLVLGLGSPLSLTAQTGGITLQVRPFFGGHYKYGEWLPLRINVTNSGASLSANIRVEMTETSGQTAWLVPVELPSGAQKQITLYVLPTSFAQVARVRVIGGTQELAHENVSLTLHPNTDYLIGILAARPEALNTLNNLNLDSVGSRTTHTLSLTLNDLPARPEGLGALDALVFTDMDTAALSAEQKSALTAWVERGGRLLIGGGASAARTLSGLPDPLVGAWQAPPNAVELSTLPALDAFGESPIRVPGPFVAAYVQGGDPVLEQTDFALVAEKRVGDGYVTYSALDLSAAPFDAWAGVVTFWKKIFAPGSAYPFNTPKDISPSFLRARQMTSVLENLPALALPPLDMLAVLLVAYIILVGPVNYLLLRRFKKLDWGWVTIPILTLLFAIGAFGISNQLRGSDVILNRVSVVEFSINGKARQAETLVGLFSPTRGTYNLQVPDNAFVIPVSGAYNPYDSANDTVPAVEIVESSPVLVRGISLNQGAMQSFAIESPAPADWSVESDLTLAEDHLRGTIVNHINAPLSSVILVSGNHYLYLDQLPSGQPRTVDDNWQSYGGNVGNLPIGTTPTTQALRQIVGVWFDSSQNSGVMPAAPYLLGWLETSPLDARVENINAARQGKTLIVVPLTLKYAPGVLHLVGRDWRVQQVSSSGQVMNCGTPNVIGVQGGHIDVQFAPPPSIRIANVKTLKVWVKNIGGETVELQSSEGKWLPVPSGTANGQLVETPEQYLKPDGTFLLRISNTTMDSRCLEYDLDLTAEIAN